MPGPAARARGRAPSRARSRCRPCRGSRPFRYVLVWTPGASTAAACAGALATVLPPIQTVTVGSGVPPDRPAHTPRGARRFADFDRRFGISPTPEHVLLASVIRQRLDAPVIPGRPATPFRRPAWPPVA